ncbi:MAG: dienelactone hydrolase family protein, partial [Pseudomonadota bacterium]
KRYILGGAWREPNYMFAQKDALSPFDRSATNGFRCMKPFGAAPLPPNVDDEIIPQVRDYTGETPVNDEAFRVIRSLYTYDKTPLEARVESTDAADPRWRRETVSFKAAYGNERVPAFVFLPRNALPPYQTVVYFPTSGARSEKSSGNLQDMDLVALLVASGRALIYPVYKGTYERKAGVQITGPATYRDWVIMAGKDLSRAIDYLETRPDIQTSRLAYVGFSLGAELGAIFPAVEPRLKACVLMIGGFTSYQEVPEADGINFAPRVTQPTLMLNGRYDFHFPLEASQRPMFRWLGAPPDQKRQVLYDTGHDVNPEQVAGEVYTWLDRYLGFVK